MSARVLRRSLAAGAAGAVVLLALPTVAGAHVEAESTTAEGTTSVALSFHHGCEDDPTTTGLRVQLPEGATDVVPEDPEGWTSTVTGNELAWTGGSVPDGQAATFHLSMTLTDPEGTTVFLPTVQVCGTAEAAWIDKSDDPEADAAAPRITAGAVVSTGGHEDMEEAEGNHGSVPETATDDEVGGAPAPSTSTSAPAESNDAAPATQNASSTSSSSAPLIIGIVAAVVVIGIVAFFLISRRGTSSSTPPSS